MVDAQSIDGAEARKDFSDGVCSHESIASGAFRDRETDPMPSNGRNNGCSLIRMIEDDDESRIRTIDALESG